MNVLFPLFLFAGLAIAIPIIIHLFNFRRYKKVLFPDIRFLKELVEQTQKHSQLKHFLILASRILAVLALVLAFAQPFFNKDKERINQGPKAMSIYIDNSFSMGIEQNSLSLLDIAKGKATEAIEGCSNNDLIQILTNDFGYNENKFLTKQDALKQLSAIRVSSKTRNASVILEKQKQLLSTEPGMKKQIVYLSDFQKSSFSEKLAMTDSIEKYFVAIKANSINNISIDTVYFETPSLLINEPNPMVVRLKNNGNEEVNTSISLLVNGQMKSVVNTTLKANELKNENITLNTSTAGNQNMTIFINDNPVNFDDTFHVAGKVSSNYGVLVINQSNANAFLSSVFKPGAQFRMDNTNVNAVNTQIFKNYSLIILNSVTNVPPTLSQAISDYIQHGGNCLTFAPQNGNIGNLNSFLETTAGCIYGRFDTSKIFVTNYTKSHEVFRDIFTKTPNNIDLPIVYKHFIIEKKTLSSEQKLFLFSNNDAFLSVFKVGTGKHYVCASSAEMSASTFPKSYWFLPILYKMAYLSSSNSINALTLNKNATIIIDNNKIGDKTIYHVGAKDIDAIPEQRAIGGRMQINLNNAIAQAGIFGIYLPEGKDSTFVGINYDRSESSMTYWDIDALKKSVQIKNATWLDKNLNLGQSLHELQHGIALWKICLLMALTFLLIEILLVRLMK